MESSEQNIATTAEDNTTGLLPVIIIPTDQEWVVVLVALCQNILLESVPLTMLSLASDIQASSFVTAEDKYRNAAIFFGLSSILTPVSCSLVNWYSFKVISIIGPAVIFFAMILTYFTQEYFIFCLLSLSIIGGFGNSMMNATSICLPTVWFCNYRSEACQLSNFGQSLGILFIPWLTKRIFIENLNFSSGDTYLLYAGLYLPLIALGFAVPKLYGINLQVQGSKKVTSKVKFRDQETAESLARSMSIFGHMLSYLIFRTYHNLMFPRVKDIVKERSLFITIPEHIMMRCVDPPYKRGGPIRHKKPFSEETSAISFSFYGVQDIQMLLSNDLPGYGCRPFYRVDIFFTGAVTELNLYYRQVHQLDYHMAVSRAMTKKDYNHEVGQQCLVIPEAFSRTFLSMLHIGVWKQLYFVLLQIALALCYFGHYIPFIFINDRDLEFDLKENPISIINCIGFGHLTGQILTFVFSFFCLDVDNLFILGFLLVTEGCLSVFTNYFEDYGLQVTYGFLTGFYMSVSVVVMVPSICRITGISNLTNAVGYVLVFQGIGIMAGTLICVNVNKSWGTVKYAYHLSGICMILSAVLLIPLKKLKKISRELDTDLV